MTESPRRQPMQFDSIDDVLAMMRANGHRVSTTCRIVLELLFEADGPVSAQFIADGRGEHQNRLEVSSVYRNLERLEELGVVSHAHFGHGPGLYMLVGSGEIAFLACERCNRVTSLDPAELEPVRELIRERFDYDARFGHFPIIGLCASCAAAEAGPDSGARDHAQGHEHHHGDYVHAHPHRHGSGPEHAHEH